MLTIQLIIILLLPSEAAGATAAAKHTDPAFTLRVYAHAMRRGEGDKEALKALVEGRHWAPAGPTTRWSRCTRLTPLMTKAPQMQGFRRMGAAGFEPATSRV